jgi:hypothetical protein
MMPRFILQEASVRELVDAGDAKPIAHSLVYLCEQLHIVSNAYSHIVPNFEQVVT